MAAAAASEPPQTETASPPRRFAAHKANLLAIAYSSPKNRMDLETKIALWREEMTRVNNIPNNFMGATHRFPQSEPIKPDHFLGDATTRAKRAQYVKEANEMRVLLTKSAVQREADAIYSKLLCARTATEANVELVRLGEFLRAGANLSVVDASNLLGRLRCLRLPFERLLRNVWTPGAESEYDVLKADLESLLVGELGRVSAESAVGRER